MGAIIAKSQSNLPWTITWKASSRYPIIADRIYDTLADAQAYVDDNSASASATAGLILTVLNDPTPKNNGVYYVKSVKNTNPDTGPVSNEPGILVKVGGAETEVAKNYSAAVVLSNDLVVGQLIYVSESETVETGEGESKVTNTYKAGFYIVNTPGSISALDTSTGASDEIGALNTRVTALEGNRVLKTDFESYKKEVEDDFDLKADVTALESHTKDGDIHVSVEDKDKWNNSQQNAIDAAKEYTDDEISKLDTSLKEYADQAELDAIDAAKSYTNDEILKVNNILNEWKVITVDEIIALVNGTVSETPAE